MSHPDPAGRRGLTYRVRAQSSNKFDFVWRGSWRSTLLNLRGEHEAKVDCRSVFSDVLHRPFVCSNVPLEQFTTNIPARNRISRFGDLAYAEFAASWSDKPFILTDCVRTWPVCQKWTLDSLLRQ